MLAAQKQEELPSLKQALSLAEAARAELDPHLPCSVRGFMLCPAKIRSMRVKVMLAVQRLLVREEQHSGFHSRSAMSLLAELRQHAETLVGSFADSPEEARGECWVYDEEETSVKALELCTVLPAADAFMCLALYWSRPAICGDIPQDDSPREAMETFFVTRARAVDCYTSAAALMPVDDKNRLVALSRAIECLCQCGSWTVQEMQRLLDDYDLSKRCAKVIWGSSSSSDPNPAGGFTPRDADDSSVDIARRAIAMAREAWDAADEKPAESFEVWPQHAFFVEIQSEDPDVPNRPYNGSAEEQESQAQWAGIQRDRFRSTQPSEAEKTLREDVDQVAPAAQPVPATPSSAPPEELLDPISSALMTDPVRLGETVLDRATLLHHWAAQDDAGQARSNPFTREVLAPDIELATDESVLLRVKAWQKEEWRAQVATGQAVAGEPAELCGLIGQPQLNGQRVVLQGWNAEKGRWVVRLSSAEHEGKEIRVKPVNLQPLEEQASNDG